MMFIVKLLNSQHLIIKKKSINISIKYENIILQYNILLIYNTKRYSESKQNNQNCT